MYEKKQYVTAGNLFTETIGLYTENFAAFWLPFLFIVFPSGIIIEYFKSLNAGHFVTGSLFDLLSYIISGAVGLYIMIRADRIYRKNESDLNGTLERAGKVLVPYILLQVLVFLGIMGGIILLVVPGIIFSLWWAVSGPVLILEGRGIGESMKRSRALTGGFKGQIFLVYLLFFVITMVIYSLYSAVSGLITGTSLNYFSFLTEITSDTLSVKYTFYSLVVSLLGPVYPLLTIILYYNLKKEKEGYLTEELAESFLSEEKGDRN